MRTTLELFPDQMYRTDAKIPKLLVMYIFVKFVESAPPEEGCCVSGYDPSFGPRIEVPVTEDRTEDTGRDRNAIRTSGCQSGRVSTGLAGVPASA